jgi:hypothetical protein
MKSGGARPARAAQRTSASDAQAALAPSLFDVEATDPGQRLRGPDPPHSTTCLDGVRLQLKGVRKATRLK